MLFRDRSIGYRTNRAARLLVRELSRRLEEAGLSIGHMPVFVALGAGEKLAQRDLARRAIVEQPTMAATLARMERDGLVERTPDPNDKRSALIALTPLALSKTAALEAAIAEVNERATAGLSTAEREQLAQLLDRLIANLDPSGERG